MFTVDFHVRCVMKYKYTYKKGSLVLMLYSSITYGGWDFQDMVIRNVKIMNRLCRALP